MHNKAILLEDDDFVVLNKPSMISMHQGTIEHNNKTLQTVYEWAEALNLTKPIYVVHRLDTHTSGCLVLAKNKACAAMLSELFAYRSIHKYYLAISDKKSNKKQGRITGLMQKSRNGCYQLSKSKAKPSFTSTTSNQNILNQSTTHANTPNSQNNAVTFFFRQKLNNTNKNLYLYYLKPVTGKTHQLRVALKSIGSPILGDTRYKGSSADRLYLHSHSLSFTYKGKIMKAQCLPQMDAVFTEDCFTQVSEPCKLDWPRYRHPQHVSANSVPANSVPANSLPSTDVLQNNKVTPEQ